MKNVARILVLLSVFVLLACPLPDTTDLSDLDPINPDPNPFDPLSDLIEGYDIYVNINNSIIKLDIEDPLTFDVVAVDLDPDIPDFYITEDDLGIISYAVYGKASDSDGNPGHYVAFTNLDTGTEYIIAGSNSSRGNRGEFIVVGEDIIYSGNGILRSFNLASDDPDAGGDEIISNSSSYVCSHFPTYCSDGMITFAENVPDQSDGTLHIVAYLPDADPSAQPVNTTAIIDYFGWEFGDLLYPLSYNGSDLISLTPSPSRNKLSKRVFSTTPAFTGLSTVVCPDTDEPVEFNKAFQTADPDGEDGPLTILYGYDSIYWFEDIPTSNGDFAVSGKDFNTQLEWVTATDDGKYIVVTTTNGIWIYDRDFNQLYSDFDYLSQATEVLWVDIRKE